MLEFKSFQLQAVFSNLPTIWYAVLLKIFASKLNNVLLNGNPDHLAYGNSRALVISAKARG